MSGRSVCFGRGEPARRLAELSITTDQRYKETATDIANAALHPVKDTQHLSGSAGSITAGCSNLLVIYRLPNTKRCIIKTEIRQWLPDSSQKLSGEPGVIQLENQVLGALAIMAGCQKAEPGSFHNLQIKRSVGFAQSPTPCTARISVNPAAMSRRLDLDKFPDSPYASELRNPRRHLRFPAELEDEYLDEHLRRVQPRVRIWTTLAALLGVAFTAAQVIEYAELNRIVLGHLLLILPMSFGLAWLAWSRDRMRIYLRVAELLTPVLGGAVAFAVANSVSAGMAEELASLTLLLIASFFFMGLMFRAAMVAGATVLLSFVAAGLTGGMAIPLLLKSMSFLATAFVLGATIGYEIEYSYRRRFLSHAMMTELADRDGLTGLRNRRAFDDHLERVWQQSMRIQSRLAVMLIDIDYFKRYNDHYGHQAGDLALQKVSSVIADFARRPLDIAARYGGEEFSLVTFDLADDAVSDIARRLCAAIESLQIANAGSACSNYITVSIGVAIAQPAINRSPDGLLQLADEALYAVKNAGRNGIIVHGQEFYDVLVTGVYKHSAH